MAHDPMKEWVVKDEILAATHRWPVIVIFAMAGALIALAAAYLWPAPFRANVEISVELNPYRVLDDQYLAAFTNAEFRNIDDYKHWQMLQLSIVVLSDSYLTETLHRLRAIDPYWDSVDQQALRNVLSANWRNAGVWLLSANADTESRADNAVDIWRDVILDFTEETITSSQALFQLELTLRSLNDQLVQNQLQMTILKGSLNQLRESERELSKLDQNAALPDEYHQQLLALNIQLADVLPAGALVLSSFPEQNSTVASYLGWIEQLSSLIEDQILSLQVREEILVQEISDVSVVWEAALQDGQGLSATLNLENRNNSSPEVRQIRPYGIAALIGSMVGLLVWIGFLLIKITRKGYR